MSPLWPDVRVLGLTTLLVSADHVQAVHWPAGLRSQPQTLGANWSGSSALDLQAVLNALLKQLPSTRWQRIALYMADQHVHILRLPAIPGDWKQIDWQNQNQQAYARALLVQTYGEDARAWPYRLQDVCPTQDAMLVTIPALASLDLNALFRTYAVQWQVQSYACALWANSRLPKTGTILSAEPHMLRLLQLERGRMQHIAALPMQTDTGYQMSATLRMADWILRERTLASATTEDCYWLVDPGMPASQDIGQQIQQRLSGHSQWHQLPVSSAVVHRLQESNHATIS